MLTQSSFNYAYEIDGNNFDGPLPTEIGGLESVVKIEIGKSETIERLLFSNSNVSYRWFRRCL